MSVLSAVFSIGVLGCHNGASTGTDDMGGMPSPDMTTTPSGPTGPAQSLVSGGLLEAVSRDQALLAYVQSPTPFRGVSSGALVVSPLPVTGTNTTVAQNAYHAFFPGIGTSNLVYSTGPTASVDKGSNAVYGAINVWRPGMSAGIQVSTGFVPTGTTAQDNATLLYWDTATASNQGTGSVMLARVADCTATACAPQSLATGVIVSEVAISFDGKYGAYVVKNGGTPVSYAVNLVTIATGAVKTIETAGTSGSISFSSDGKLLASVGPAGALQLTTTATGAAATWGALPAGSKSVNVSFADSATLLVLAQDAAATTMTIYKTGAATASTVASGPSTLTMVVFRNSKYLFTSMTPANAIGDVEAFDHSVTSPTAISVATAAAVGSIGLSPDQTYARVLESYSAKAGNGTLTLAALPGGTPSTVQAGVQFGSQSFLGTHALLYIDHANADTLTQWLDGSNTTYATGVNTYRVRSKTLYFNVAQADTMYGYAPGIYSTSL
jgi:hypothetical protein